MLRLVCTFRPQRAMGIPYRLASMDESTGTNHHMPVQGLQLLFGATNCCYTATAGSTPGVQHPALTPALGLVHVDVVQPVQQALFLGGFLHGTTRKTSVTAIAMSACSVGANQGSAEVPRAREATATARKVAAASAMVSGNSKGQAAHIKTRPHDTTGLTFRSGRGITFGVACK